MKCRIAVPMLLVCLLAAVAKADETIAAQRATSSALSLSPDSAPAGLPAIQSSAPFSLADQLNLYQQGMQMIFQKTWEDLEQIAQAADLGAMDRQQANYASMELYQRAMLSFQLLRTLYRSTQNEFRKTEASRPNAGFSVLDVAITVPPATASVDVPEPIAQLLDLTPDQVAAIQSEIVTQRKKVQPLVQQLAANDRVLAAVGLSGHFDQKHVRKLAAEQAEILQKLIIANTELDERLYNLLNVEQQHRADELRALQLISTKP